MGLKIFVNASSLRVAGGKSVGVNFLSAFCRDTKGSHMLAVVPRNDPDYGKINSRSLTKVSVPRSLNRSSLRWYTDHVWLDRAVHAYKPDVIFSMGNIAAPTNFCPQVLLLQWAYAVYSESYIWDRMPMSERFSRKARVNLFRRRLRYADHVITQTETIGKRLGAMYSGIQTSVVPNASSHPRSFDPVAAGNLRKSGLTLLCLSRYYSHKNLEILVDVAIELKKLSAPCRLLLTIDPGGSSAAAKLVSRIDSEDLVEYIDNIGPVDMDEIPSLYSRVDALILPTLLESFTGTYAEAASFGKPILTSDLDFARETAWGQILFFDPLEVDSIVAAILKLVRGEPIPRIEPNAINNLSWDEAYARIVNVLEDCAGS